MYNRDIGNGLAIKIYSNALRPFQRAQGLLESEPETIRWIDSFEEDTVFYDVGANVGTYSLYAGTVKKNVKVYSFEPFSANYFLLNKNIELNQLNKSVTGFPIAIAGESKIDLLHMKTTDIGTAEKQFGTNDDYLGGTFDSVFEQGMVGCSITDLVNRHEFKFPNYIKIDVDGLEEEIVVGSKDVFTDKRLKSVLIELSMKRKEELDRVHKFFYDNGFQLESTSPGEIIPAKQEIYECHQYVFSREPTMGTQCG
ncbi:FkbM family methyltransferase [Planctomycetota bacterium]